MYQHFHWCENRWEISAEIWIASFSKVNFETTEIFRASPDLFNIVPKEIILEIF